MEVSVKIRFNASKEKFEAYGGNRYLIYLPFEEDEESMKIIVSILSRKIGAPENKFSFLDKDEMGNWVFQVN